MQAIIIAQSSRNRLVSTIALGCLPLISKSIAWSTESNDPLKKNHFVKKLLTLFAKFWPNIDLPVSNK